VLRCTCSRSARAGSCKCRVVTVRELPRYHSCAVTQLCHLGIQFEHQSLTRFGARSSGQYTVDKKSSSVCPTAGVQQRLHGRAASMQYSKNKMSETDVAQGQSAMPHILRCFDNGCPTKLVNPNGPGRNWPRQCIMEIPKFLNSCNFMPWHPALT